MTARRNQRDAILNALIAAGGEEVSSYELANTHCNIRRVFRAATTRVCHRESH
jgi:hypothetical protein